MHWTLVIVAAAQVGMALLARVLIGDGIDVGVPFEGAV